MLKQQLLNYLIRNYNLGYNYYFVKYLDKAESNLINAIQTKTDHASSHLMLGYVNTDAGNRVQSLMALYFFLLLEPDTQRSEEAFVKLRDAWKGNAREGDDGEIVINMSLPGNLEDMDDMASLEFMLTLIEFGAKDAAKEALEAREKRASED